jgi:hypothetical protein
MTAAAVIAVALAVCVVAVVIFGLRFGGLSADLATSEADRDRLEEKLREVIASDELDDAASVARIATLLKEQEALRAEIRRRRRPGDALARLRLLSEAEGEATGNDHHDKP